MRTRLRRALVFIAAFSQPVSAQARVLSAPPEPSLLNLTGAWTRASTLGDLRDLKTPSDYLELRVWGGFGFGATQGVVLRRTGGHWSAFLARVRRCELQIPVSVGDTASQSTMQRYVAEARRQCDKSLGDVRAGVRIITADTLAVDQLDVPDSSIGAAWMTAVGSGVLQLPGQVKHTAAATNDFTYVVELRRGNEYRASQIADVEPPETEADRQIKAIFAAIGALLPFALRLKP
jgi:hypothetical protein